MRKIIALVVIVLLLSFLISEIAGMQLVSANPNLLTSWPGGTVPPDNSTKPPTVIIHSEQNANYSSPIISIPIQATVGESTTASWTRIKEVYYAVDWQTNYTSVYKFTPVSWNMSEPIPENFFTPPPSITQLSTNLNLTDIPEGKHTLTVYAVEDGGYSVRKESQLSIYGYVTIGYGFQTNSSSTLSFTVDTVSPSIWLSIENSTYYSSEVSLSFKVDESLSQLSYSLDNQSNVTLSGNTTLTGLTYGRHNIIVYGTDTFGNVDVQTVTFDVAQPFPTTLVIIAVVVVCSSVLALYGINKRKSK
ncbi:MAG: hypothetical protein M1490_00325 [Candidatus Bathyarchaeota archaeon]|nr:hypothetical protein [Candidatus Bathyarchaeota archaeon]